MLSKTMLKFLILKNYVIVENSKSEGELKHSDVFNKFNLAIAPFNYKLSNDLIVYLDNVDELLLVSKLDDIFNLLMYTSGKVKHKIFFKSFPNLNKYEGEELHFHTFLHYLTTIPIDNKEDYGYLPEMEDYFKDKEVKIDFSKLIELNPITLIEAKTLLINKYQDDFKANSPININNFTLYKDIFITYGNEIVVDEIPFKENISKYILSIYITGENGRKQLTKDNLRFCKTVTDVLRVIYAINGGNDQLTHYRHAINPEIRKYGPLCKFKSYSRKVRKVIFEKFEEILAKANPLTNDEFIAHKSLFKHIFRGLHIGEFKDVFPLTFKKISELRNNDIITTKSEFESYLHDLKNPDSFSKLLNYVRKYPGFFVRNFEYISFKLDDQKLADLYNVLEEVVDQVNPLLLIQYLNHLNYKKSNQEKDYRTVRIVTSAFEYVKLPLKARDNRVNEKAISIIEASLSKRFATKDKIENVYLDPVLKNYKFPLRMREASVGRKIMSFGSTIKLDPQKNIIRLFTYWRNSPKDRIDIDLACDFYTDNLAFIDSIYFNNYRSQHLDKSFVKHSGDIVTAPEGASEFIDIDLKFLNKCKVKPRYVLCTNSSYLSIPYKDIPECFAGVMSLTDEESQNALYDAQNVLFKQDLMSDSNRSLILYVFDLKENKLIWADVAAPSTIKKIAREDSVVGFMDNKEKELLKDILKPTLNMYDFFKLHASHIKFVENKNDALAIIDDSETSLVDIFNPNNLHLNWL